MGVSALISAGAQSHKSAYVTVTAEAGGFLNLKHEVIGWLWAPRQRSVGAFRSGITLLGHPEMEVSSATAYGRDALSEGRMSVAAVFNYSDLGDLRGFPGKNTVKGARGVGRRCHLTRLLQLILSTFSARSFPFAS